MPVSPLHHVPMKPEYRSPFSAGFVADNARIIMLSGCGPVPTYHKHPHDPVEEARWFDGDIEQQIRMTFENIRISLASAGAEMKDICRLLIFMNDVAAGQDVLNEVTYEIFGRENPPARTLIEAKNAHPKMLIEIEATAAVPLDRARQ